MSCKLTAKSQIPNLCSYFSYLFPESQLRGSHEEQHNDNVVGWDCEWGWEDVNLHGGDSKSSKHTSSNAKSANASHGSKNQPQTGVVNEDSSQAIEECLQKVLVSMSPLGDVIVLAHETRVVILNLKCAPLVSSRSTGASESLAKRPHYSEDKFEEIYRGQPQPFHDESVIKAVRCVPLASLRRSSCGTPDWTCIILGFSNGYVRFYSVEHCSEILSQRFHDGPVQQIKMLSVESIQTSPSEEQPTEELSVLYENIVISIDGFSLFQTLRACRSQLARAAATEDGQAGLMVSPLLTFKKWRLSGQANIVDHGSAGIHSPCVFDRLVHKSATEGALGRISTNRVRYSRYIVVGKEPYVCFYQANEDGNALGIGDIASAMATKVKSAFFSATGLSSWFGGGAPHPDPSATASPHQQQLLVDKAALEQTAITLSTAYGLADKLRVALAVELSPDLRMAAVTDWLGRVFLIDVTSGLAIRMWKGYREAQVQFIQVSEPSSSGATGSTPSTATRRRVTYLCIHSPRRNILEIFALRHGLRVAAFNVPRSSRLVSTNYRMAGHNADSTMSQSWSSGGGWHPFYLIDPSGTVSVVEVPFHLALTSVNSHRACDYDSLRLMRTLFQQHSEVSEQLFEDCCELLEKFRLVPCLEMALGKIFATKYLTGAFIVRVLEHIVQVLKADIICRFSTSQEKTRILAYIQSYLSLLDTFNQLSEVLADSTLAVRLDQAQNPEPMEKESAGDDEDNPLDPEAFADLLSWEVSDAERCYRLYENYTNIYKKDQHPTEASLLYPHEVTALEFLDWFPCTLQGLVEQENFAVDVHLNSSLAGKPHRCARTGRFFFQAYVESVITLPKLLRILESSQISSVILLRVFINWFLSEERPRLSQVSRVKPLLSHLFKTLKQQHIQMEPHSTSSSKSPRHSQEPPTMLRPATTKTATSEAVQDVVTSVLSECLSLTAKSTHLLAGFQVAMVIRVLLAESAMEDTSLAEVSPTDEAAQRPSLGQVSTQQLPQWHTLCTRLEDLLWFRLLLLHSPEVSTEQKEHKDTVDGLDEISVGKVQDSGTGFLQEVFARWAVHHEMGPAQLEKLFRSLGRGLVDSDSRFVVSETSFDKESAHVPVLFKQVYENLPHTLEYDSVLANAAWENLVAWTKASRCTEYLQRSVDFLTRMGPAGGLVVCGVQSIMWDMHLKKPVQNVAYLLQRCGDSMPASKDWLQEANMPEDAVDNFLTILVSFMKLFIRSLQRAEVVPAFGREPHWRECIASGRLSLVELAVERPVPRLGLLRHHLQMLLVLACCVGLRIQAPVVKPLALFDNVGVQCLFGSLSSPTLHPSRPSHEVDPDDDEEHFTSDNFQDPTGQSQDTSDDNLPVIQSQVERRRGPFLQRVVSCAVESFARSTEMDTGRDYQRHVDCALLLAQMWRLPRDLVTSHHVLQLFSWGRDQQAIMFVELVRDQSSLAMQLFHLLVQRLALLYCRERDHCVPDKYRALMPPSLATSIEYAYPKSPPPAYISSLGEAQLNVRSVRLLLDLVLKNISHESREYRQALTTEEFLARVAPQS